MDNPTQISSPQNQNIPPAQPRNVWTFKLIAIIVIVAVVLIGGGVLYFYVKKAQPNTQSQQNQNTIQTADWKTYANGDYGFSFQYPKEWGDPKIDIMSTGVGADFPITTQNNSVGFLNRIYYNQDLARNSTFDEEVNLAANSFAQSGGYLKSRQNIVIDGKNAVRLEGRNGAGGDQTEVYIPVDTKGNIFTAYYYVKASPPVSITIEDFNAFLSTIKFSEINTKKGDGTDYKLIKQAQTDNMPPTRYDDDGIISSGTYAGYHRIVALQITGEMYSSVAYYVFITQDYKKFYFDSDSNLNSSNYLPDFDKSKVVGNVPNIPLNHPLTIPLGNFILVRQNYFYASTFDDFTIGNNPQEISSVSSGLRFYADQSLEAPTAAHPELNNYISGKTQLKVIDQFGLIFIYNLVSKENYTRQQQHNSTDYFENPFYKKADFDNSVTSYNSYDIPFPGVCGMIGSSGYVLKNISMNDLVSIGTTVQGTQLYKLTNTNHVLNQDEYKLKITSQYEANYEGARANAEQLNNGAKEPSYADYVAKNPIIVVKDPWNRFIAFGEFQYQLMGGCGKPVIYLYPTTPTEVKISLEKPTHFTTAIPSYKDGWNVLANPDGLLKDLQPQYTNCSAINNQVFGSEYAGYACKNNSYPYLYWAGQVDNIYPKANTGWVVPKDNLEAFISQKLEVIGLNEKERADMLGYWVPELLTKNTPYYRISFFQTADMNNFAPMDITPKPDTLIRVFLDWSPLTENNINIQPQTLTHINRQGFTVVEWGGLKQ